MYMHSGNLMFNSPGTKDVNCRQLCFIRYQIPIFRSKPLARNDSVDVIMGKGIVLLLPSGFVSLVSKNGNIILPFSNLFILSQNLLSFALFHLSNQ